MNVSSQNESFYVAHCLVEKMLDHIQSHALIQQIYDQANNYAAEFAEAVLSECLYKVKLPNHDWEDGKWLEEDQEPPHVPQESLTTFSRVVLKKKVIIEK